MIANTDNIFTLKINNGIGQYDGNGVLSLNVSKEKPTELTTHKIKVD